MHSNRKMRWNFPSLKRDRREFFVAGRVETKRCCLHGSDTIQLKTEVTRSVAFLRMLEHYLQNAPRQLDIVIALDRNAGNRDASHIVQGYAFDNQPPHPLAPVRQDEKREAKNNG